MAHPTLAGIVRPGRIALGLCLALATSLAWSSVDQALLEKAEALLKAGRAEEAYQLLEPLELSGAGDQVYDYLLGSAALDSHRPSKATFVYERILAESPGFVGVRADMGRAYLALNDYARAKIEFESVLAIQSLPPDLRAAVEKYAKTAEARSLDQRSVVSGYVEMGVGSDSNIGSATGSASINLPAVGLYAPAPPTGKQTADNYTTLGAGAEVSYKLTEQWGLFGGGDYRGRNYQTYQDSGYATLDVRAGVDYSAGTWLVRTGLTFGQYNLNHTRVRDTRGASVDWRMAMGSSSQFSLGASYSDASYLIDSSTNQNTQTTALSAGWLGSLGDGSTVFSLTGTYGIERAVGGRDDGDRRFLGPRLLIQNSFAEKMGAFATAGATYSRYGGTNTLYLSTRDETLYDLTLGLTWSVGKGLSVRPQFSAIRNNSNAELYSYDKNDLSVNLRYDY